MLLGVLVSARTHAPLLGKRRLLQFHEQSLVRGPRASGIHILAIAGHEAFATEAPSIVATLPGTLGLATFLGLGILAISRWLRGRLSQRAFWRVHMLAYAVCRAGVAHAALAGGARVDTPVRALYLLGGALIVLLYRCPRRAPGPPQHRTARSSSAAALALAARAAREARPQANRG